jgi:hypothetical protein
MGADLARNDALAALLVAEVNQLAQAGRISRDCSDVMLRCFAVNPELRPSAATLLQHAWFTAGAPYPVPVRVFAGRMRACAPECRRLTRARGVCGCAPSQPCPGPPQQTLEELKAIIAQI